MRDIELIDTFAGIGGFSLAAHKVGWRTRCFVEWDRKCQMVLNKNFPGIPIFGDIVDFNKKIENGEITRSDTKLVISGGFPCQPFSHAGLRKGEEDDRHLWPELLKTIDLLRPDAFVGENVAGLASMENGETLNRILHDLEAEGYHTETFLIPAAGVGAWHRRDRIWIVAVPDSRHPEPSGRIKNEETDKAGNQPRPEPASRNSARISETIPNTDSKRLQKQRRLITAYQRPGRAKFKCEDQWGAEPNVGRVADGIPNRVDRLKQLGNAIVPQVAYQIFKAINEILKTDTQ